MSDNVLNDNIGICKTFEPCAIRTHEEMKDVLMYPDSEGPKIHYYMIRGGEYKKNITVWEPGDVGGEFIKTHGHYHIGNVKETYWIVGGRGIVLLQKRKVGNDNKPIDDIIESFVAIKVKAGDVVHMPPEFGHLVVNTGNKWLVTIDNSILMPNDNAKTPNHADYEQIKKMHGFCYYVVNSSGDIKFVKNKNYKVVLSAKWMTPEQWNDESLVSR